MYLGAVRSGAYGHKTGDGAVIGTVQLAIRTFTEPTRGAFAVVRGRVIVKGTRKL